MFLVLYFLTDHPLFFNSLGYLPISPKMIGDIDVLNNYMWLGSVVIDLHIDLIESMDGKISNYLLSMIINLSDLPLIFYFLQFEAFGPILAGFCGAVGSALSLYRMW